MVRRTIQTITIMVDTTVQYKSRTACQTSISLPPYRHVDDALQPLQQHIMLIRQIRTHMRRRREYRLERAAIRKAPDAIEDLPIVTHADSNEWDGGVIIIRLRKGAELGITEFSYGRFQNWSCLSHRRRSLHHFRARTVRVFHHVLTHLHPPSHQ